MSRSSVSARSAARRPHHVRVVLGVLLALVLALGGTAAVYLWNVGRTYEAQATFVEIPRSTPGSDASTASDASLPPEATGPGTNYLLLGSDQRSPEGAKASGIYGQRSDVMMLVHVDAARTHAYVLSFPRDLYIDIPGRGKDRINAALAYGGIPLTVQTVQAYLGVPIEHVAMIDFDGIYRVVDALGGVDVDVPVATTTDDGYVFTEGINHMDGQTALRFVRERYSLPDGDFGRNAYQRALLAGIADKIISADTLTSPTKIQTLVNRLSPYLTVDSGLDARGMADLAFSLRGLTSENISFGEVPHGEPFMTSGGASVVATDEDGVDALRRALADDTMDEWAASS